MKTILWLIPLTALAATDLVEKMEDRSLNSTQRNDACYELRGRTQGDVLAAMRRALSDSDLRACAADNLRAAKALDLFRDALHDPQPEVRAIAVREIGGFGRLEDLPALGAATHDSDLLVASNAVYGLAMCPGKEPISYLLEIARRGGITGEQALHLLAQRRAPEALTIARAFLSSQAISDRLAAISVIGQLGDRSDLASLREIQKKETGELSNKGRGFGFTPVFSLSRAAKTAIESIEGRYPIQSVSR
ncbi:MAG: HEAT repeat domain-containing protein [Acidobacteria bacterium]|nr:HEAT repeat domain-containing protein [Acidobacteriota bacterium]